MGKVTSTLTLCGFLAVIVIPAYFFKWSYVVGNAASEPPRAEEQAARADLAKRLPRAEPHVVAAPRVEAPRVVAVANTPLARCSSADTVQTLHKVLDQYFGAASGGG